MDKYSFVLKSFRAIKSANIDLNGITVLAGENGCGKSTLTRTLFCLIDVISHYDEYVFNDYKSQMKRLFRRFDMIQREISMFFRDTDKRHPPKSQNNWFLNEYGINEVDEIRFLYRDAIVYYAKVLEDCFTTHTSRNRLERLLQYIGLQGKTFDPMLFQDTYMERAQQFYDEFQVKISRRDTAAVLELIDDKYEIRLSSDMVQFVENDVRLITTKQVGHLFNIQRAIYIDSPMALCTDVISNPLWDHFNSLIASKRQTEWSFAEKKMKLRIQRVMHGSLKMTDDDLFREELHYVREDNLDIPIVQAATGLKSFAYVLRLLENGLLDDSTMLIIDEPEVHLHPQWVVEFARVLVLLNKELGVKVLIASHNPDMVAAIQAIARNENQLENVTYYQANSTGDFTYQYKKLGAEIGEIFQSFNIALERIQYYGASNN